jgi:hypothetical protein
MTIRLFVAAVVAFLMGAIVTVQAATTYTMAQHGLKLSKDALTIAHGDRLIFTAGHLRFSSVYASAYSPKRTCRLGC